MPHFGSHIEPMMGTLGNALHELPGTAFSTPAKRSEYDSEAQAAFTLSELETYIGEFITGVYHEPVHSGLKVQPIKRWTVAILGTGDLPAASVAARPEDDERIRCDFMPCIDRTIQNYGVRIDEIHEYSDALRPYSAESSRGRKRTFVFRRDPSDRSNIPPSLSAICVGQA